MPPFTQRIGKLIQFLGIGLPAFILAVPANYALVEWAQLPKPWAYALVLVGQVTMNFFMCRWLLFPKKSATKWYIDFAAFFSGILFIRLLDWAFYTLLVQQVGVYYLAAQLLNVVLFSVVKFLFTERVLT